MLTNSLFSRLSDKYRVASEYAKPEREIPGSHDQDPTTILSRLNSCLLNECVLGSGIKHTVGPINCGIKIQLYLTQVIKTLNSQINMKQSSF